MKKKAKSVKKSKEIPKELKSIALTFLFAVIALALVVGLIKITRLGTVGKAFDYGDRSDVNLADYPYPFIENDQLNAEIVVGDGAPIRDRISANNIENSLKAMEDVVAPTCIDSDGDGYGVCPNCNITSGCTYDGNDCNDSNSSINPGAEDICNNGIDEDCDGEDNICAVGTPVFMPAKLADYTFDDSAAKLKDYIVNLLIGDILEEQEEPIAIDY